VPGGRLRGVSLMRSVHARVSRPLCLVYCILAFSFFIVAGVPRDAQTWGLHLLPFALFFFFCSAPGAGARRSVHGVPPPTDVHVGVSV